MSKYRIEQCRPDWYKGFGPIYQIHDETGPLRRLGWDYEPTALAVCERLNNGLELIAELNYKLHGKEASAVIPAHLAEPEAVLYAHVVDRLPEQDRAASSDEEKRDALRRNGYTEVRLYWEPIKEL